MKHFLFSVLFLIAASMFVLPTVQAGGGNVMLTSQSNGVVNEKGVEVTITVFDPYKNKLDWPELSKYALDPSSYDPIGVTDLEVELEFVEPQQGQYCKMTDGGKTNIYGQTKGICYSSIEGGFIIKAKFLSDKPLYEGGPNAKDSNHTRMISFYKETKYAAPSPIVKYTPTPKPNTVSTSKVSPKNEAPPLDDKLFEVEKENEEQRKQIEELMKKVAAQQEEVSALKKVVLQLQGWFEKLRGFLSFSN